MMTSAILISAAFLSFTFGLHLVSVGIAIVRCRTRESHLAPPQNAPPVTLVRPVCGGEQFVESTLASSFDLDYPDYEIIFCVAQARDPAIPILQGLIAAHPQARATIIIGDERISANPKLNNCFKGWNAAAHDWIILA